jgi:hypothetical protein
MDRLTLRTIKHQVRRGGFDKSEMARDFVGRVRQA